MLNISNIDLTLIYDFAQDLVDMYRKELKDQRINASGTLSKSTNYDIDINDKEITIYFIREAYAYWVDNGRQPSRGEMGAWETKYEDIERWLRQKIANGNFIPRNGREIPHTDKEIRRAVGGIVHKITYHGYYGYDQSGKHILETVLQKANQLGIIDRMCSILYDAYDNEIQIDINTFYK